MQTLERVPQTDRPARYTRAEEAAENGYTVTPSGPGSYWVRKPDGTRYMVTEGRCNCPATVACKHEAMVETYRAQEAARAEAERNRQADAILNTAYAMDARATAELIWDRGSRFTEAGLRYRAEAVRLYDRAYRVRFEGRAAA